MVKKSTLAIYQSCFNNLRGSFWETKVFGFRRKYGCKATIYKRHNMIARKLAEELKKAHPEAIVWQERTWQIDQERLKPDITMLSSGKAFFIELTVSYERTADILAQLELEKEQKYHTHIVANMPELEQYNIGETEIMGIAIETTGTMNSSTIKKQRKLNIHKQAKNLQLMTLSLSTDIWHVRSA